MEDFRSKSCGDGRMQIESYRGSTAAASTYGGVNGMQDLRCYSASYASSKSWSLSDPELQRKKRVASYKVYTVEGKVKGTFRKSFRWIKDRYSRVVYGWW